VGGGSARRRCRSHHYWLKAECLSSGIPVVHGREDVKASRTLQASRACAPTPGDRGCGRLFRWKARVQTGMRRPRRLQGDEADRTFGTCSPRVFSGSGYS